MVYFNHKNSVGTLATDVQRIVLSTALVSDIDSRYIAQGQPIILANHSKNSFFQCKTKNKIIKYSGKYFWYSEFLVTIVGCVPSSF